MTEDIESVAPVVALHRINGKILPGTIFTPAHHKQRHELFGLKAVRELEDHEQALHDAMAVNDAKRAEAPVADAPKDPEQNTESPVADEQPETPVADAPKDPEQNTETPVADEQPETPVADEQPETPVADETFPVEGPESLLG